MQTKILEKWIKHNNQCLICKNFIGQTCDLAQHRGQIHELWPLDNVEVGEQCEEFSPVKED